MRPHIRSPVVLQYRKWVRMFSRGDSMWCLFFENSGCENWGRGGGGIIQGLMCQIEIWLYLFSSGQSL